ncbi:head GIN domain-containing protein [Dokdonia pacifica]|uniref:Putative auto-transporter adhesin, head GIN domain n=1 Tax=Dokdonia pacifica TaxID=1627892 RepID=A0A239DDU9_9FLAO|nr:head GIN domain-containing protein [Dokdonia pacifica]SNS30024.1 Putative auto-transporter adhesin, head GIN domain [Dokdonia pacifica]
MTFKSIITIVLVSFLSMQAFAQKPVKLSSDTTTKSFDYSGYTQLDVASDFHVNVSLGQQDAITVNANSNLMEYVNIYKEGNTLFLRLKKNTWFKGKMILDVQLSTNMITDYNASSDAIVILNTPLTSDTVRINCKGDAVFKGNITADTLLVNAKSDAEIKITGSAKKMTANLKSDSEFKNRDFKVQDLKIVLNGDSEAVVTVTNTLDAIASGDSELRYAGNPSKVKQIAKGDSDITAIK